ncbi:MAG: YbaN family protein [Treponema sp.]|nr:YbaN family protein [Treponema sp.]
MILSKIFFMAGGFLCLGLGIAGVVLPILPATPFLLGAAFCFMKSSGRLYRWLMNHKYFGPRIRRIGEEGLTLKEKISIYAVVLAMLLPVIIFSPSLHLRLFLIVLLALKAFVFIRIKTARGGAVQAGTVQGERESAENTDVK